MIEEKTIGRWLIWASRHRRLLHNIADWAELVAIVAGSLACVLSIIKYRLPIQERLRICAGLASSVATYVVASILYSPTAKRAQQCLRAHARVIAPLSVTGALGSILYFFFNDSTPRTRIAFQIAPVTCACILWERLSMQHKRNTYQVSLLFCGASIGAIVAGLIAISNSTAYPALATTLLLAGTVASFFIITPAQAWIASAVAHPRAATIALTCGAAGIVYYSLRESLIERAVLRWSASAVLFSIRQIVDNTSVNYQGRGAITVIRSEYFGIEMYPACSGLEGFCLFVFLLSALLMCDWPILKARCVTSLYAVALTYVFAANVLRIVSLFLLGYWAHRPSAGELARSMRGAPVDIFHSYAGAVYYLIAFGLFVAWLYWTTPRTKLDILATPDRAR